MNKQYNFLKAKKSYKAGEKIIKLVNKVTSAINPARLQINKTKFILPPFFIKHSCSPNSYIDWNNMSLLAKENIQKNEEITYHYGFSEDDFSI